MAERRFDLEERLLRYTASIVRLTDQLPNTRAGNHIAGQLLRSGTSPLPNHAEAEGAESRSGFIHKMGICHKELRESRRWLRLIRHVPLLTDCEEIDRVLAETDELVRIFAASIRTARSNEKSTGSCREEPATYLNLDSPNLKR
jgi:four helix bundle protein